MDSGERCQTLIRSLLHHNLVRIWQWKLSRCLPAFRSLIAQRKMMRPHRMQEWVSGMSRHWLDTTLNQKGLVKLTLTQHWYILLIRILMRTFRVLMMTIPHLIQFRARHHHFRVQFRPLPPNPTASPALPAVPVWNRRGNQLQKSALCRRHSQKKLPRRMKFSVSCRSRSISGVFSSLR